MACRLDADALLALWERTLAAGAPGRDDALLQALPDALAAPRTLGERNARLLALHAQLFGSELALLSHCPACGSAAQFSADCEALAARPPATDAAASRHRLEAQGHAIEFRLPDSADIAAASGAPDDDAFARELLARCVLACTRNGARVPPHELPAPLLDALSQRMEALDPAASLSFELACPQCSTPWEARLDVGPLLWQKLQATAERVLLDVDALARAYGWTEPEVLRLSPLRRAAYLQLATA
ncbi:hypothetical protein [Piscinibacter sp.]|jgi:hypothetical protein|uniref:hypothetical protein n=1 Tax=Piscinibacter sp. TaxID=1903157 RepID=UPI002F4088E9